jgi:hypothetical protein
VLQVVVSEQENQEMEEEATAEALEAVVEGSGSQRHRQ